MAMHNDAEKEEIRGSFGYTDSQLYKFMFRYALPYKKSLTTAFIYLIFFATITSISPIILMIAVDRFSDNTQDIKFNIMWIDNLSSIIKSLLIPIFSFIDIVWIEVGILSIYYLIMEILLFVISYKLRYVIAEVGLDAVLQMRGDLFEHMQYLDQGYHDRNEVGRLMSRVTSDVSSIQQFIGGAVIMNIVNLVTVVFAISIMIQINVKLTLVSLSLIIPVLILSRLAKNFARPRRKEARKTNAILMANLAESIAGIKVTKGLNRETKNKIKFSKINEDRKKAIIRAMDVNATFFPTMLYISAIAIGVLFYFGGIEVLNGNITPGVLFAFLNYNTILFRPVVILGNFFEQLQDALTGAERVYALLDTETTVPKNEHLPNIPEIKGDVKFNNINFEYIKGLPIYDDFNLHVSAGTVVAFVGTTGAGKTTIINILSRLYDFQDGSLLIDDNNIRDYNLKSYRNQIASVPQDFFLFSSSIRQNLEMGDPNATDDEMWDVLHKVGLKHYIMRFPEGLDTELQERGGRLSIGQRQLVVFASILLADPKIIILDEATSSIDVFTEISIQRAMKILLKGRTAFIIAHRLSTIVDADMICTIDNGKLIEKGTHKELIMQRGHYFELVKHQVNLAEMAMD